MRESMDEAASSHHAPPSKRRALLQQPELAETQASQIHGQLGEPHDIFLSHSGQEKKFVKKLDRALRNVGYDPFFDIRSIPAGKIFPPHILHNASECKLGVVVLSPGFLTSKWPMLELYTMRTSPRNPILLPLFFRIQPHDVKFVSPMWRDEWKKLEEKDPSRVNIREWERATIELSRIQGEVYQEHMGEEAFIEVVLLRIGSIIRPPLRYDIRHLTGHERLTQEVAQKFEEVPATIYTSHQKVPAIGFFALGGQGKTTICKLMVNHYASAYAGRSALIEFPSNDCNEKEVVRQCNKALQRLTNSNIDHIDDFDHCLQQMREQMASLNVFLAIDNVWEICLHFAQRILDVGFSRGSKILVTSRSRQVLLNLLEDTSYVKPLPGVNEKEAHQIFVKSFNRNQAGLGVRLEDADVHDVTNWLRYDGGYHPLTISAVGVSLGRTGGHDWHATWELERHNFTGCDSVADKAIKINFNSIPKPRRDMFLDVALICIPMLERGWQLFSWQPDFLSTLTDELNFYNDVQIILLSAIYKGEMEKHAISMSLMQLAYDGLLEFEDPKVHVHDLYKELAAREAAAVSPRFILMDKDILPDINWAEAERIVSWSREISMPEHVSGVSVPNLRVLIAETGNAWGPIHMPKLRFLSLRIDYRSNYNMDLRYMPELTWLELNCIFTKFPELRVFKDISRLTNLSVLILQGYNVDLDEDEDEDLNGLCLDGLVNLQMLSIQGIGSLQKINGLGSLINLKYFNLLELPQLRKVGSFNSSFTQLQLLNIVDCHRLRVDDVGWISPPNLRFLRLSNLCNNFRLLGEPDVRGITAIDFHGMLALESLELTVVEEGTGITVNVYGLPKLKTLRIVGVVRINFDCDGLPGLESLAISNVRRLKQLDLSSFKGLTNLTHLEIADCRSLREIEWSSLNDLTNLTRLQIRSCPHLWEITGEPKGINQTLRFLTFKYCPINVRISGIHLLTNCQVDVL